MTNSKSISFTVSENLSSDSGTAELWGKWGGGGGCAKAE